MDDIFCITCGFYAVPSAEWEEDWNEYGHTDSAHYPNWSDTPSEERDIIVSLEDTGRLPHYLRD